MKGAWAWQRLTATTVAVFVMSGVAACGQNEFTYIRDREGTTYFKVPSSFSKVDSYPIDLFLNGHDPASAAAAEARNRVWSTAFDRAEEPNAAHLLGSAEPFVYATVHKLDDEERGWVSLNRLRDFFLPVTKERRAMLAEQAQAFGQQPPFTNFELLLDEPVTRDGGRGVHVRFNYRFKDTVQTFDLTSLLDEAGDTVSALVISCQTQCFQARMAEIDRIKDSFKLIRLPG
ncbi:hypothetical protein [Nonomuraea sp. NPDC050310]|uniref:hypothetical protein n=1 Tax=unclassified Nonomuraea TaxID=2593643 RepID=UPI0034071FA6